MTQWRNRITERRQMKIGELDKNKFNPKTHPDNQKRRLDAILNKFGQVGEIYAWHSERNNGNLTIFDGNGRHSLDPDQTWDIAITDLTDAEVDELVLMYDPVAQLAQIDIPQAMSLMTDIHEPDPVLDGFLSDIAAEAGFQRDGGELEEDDPFEEWEGMPEFEHEDKSSYQAITVHFFSEDEVKQFAEFIEKPITSKTRQVWFGKHEQMDYGNDRYIEA